MKQQNNLLRAGFAEMRGVTVVHHGHCEGNTNTLPPPARPLLCAPRRCCTPRTQKGITPEIGRGVLSAALMMLVKEKIHSTVKGAIVGSRMS